MKIIRQLMIAAAAAAFAVSGAAKAQETYDINYSGDLTDLIPKLRQMDPRMTIAVSGQRHNVPINLAVTRATKVDVLRRVGEQAGTGADLTYFASSNDLSIKYSQAAPIVDSAVKRNADGSVEVAFGRARPELLCQALEPCAIEMQAGETINRLDVGDKKQWEITPSAVGEGEKKAIVLVVKPAAQGLKTKMLVITNRRIYSVALLSPANPEAPADTRLYFTYAQN